jgi:hypothetical protein
VGIPIWTEREFDYFECLVESSEYPNKDRLMRFVTIGRMRLSGLTYREIGIRIHLDPARVRLLFRIQYENVLSFLRSRRSKSLLTL